jgi:hypothetical protein
LFDVNAVNTKKNLKKATQREGPGTQQGKATPVQ